MATAMRSLQATGLVGGVSAESEVSSSQSASLRCAWKGAAFKAGSNFSASVPSRKLKIRRAAPRSSLGPSGGGGGERLCFGYL